MYIGICILCLLGLLAFLGWLVNVHMLYLIGILPQIINDIYLNFSSDVKLAINPVSTGIYEGFIINGELRYAEPGPPSNDHCYILQSGSGSNIYRFEGCLRFLLENGRGHTRVFIIGIDWNKDDLHLLDYTHLLANYINRVNPRSLTLIGHSFGGIVCLNYVLFYEDTRITNLVTVCTPINGIVTIYRLQALGWYLSERFNNIKPCSPELKTIRQKINEQMYLNTRTGQLLKNKWLNIVSHTDLMVQKQMSYLPGIQTYYCSYEHGNILNQSQVCIEILRQHSY